MTFLTPRFGRCSLITTLLLAAAVPAAAQPGIGGPPLMDGGAVYASGRGEIVRRANRLRVTVQLEGQAGGMREALERLAAREKKALKKLEVLEADPDSIKVGPAELPAEASSQRDQMMQMFGAQIRNSRPGRQFKMPQLAVVRKQIVAEWELPDAEGDAYLLACYELATSINDADLADAANPDEVPPEVEEVMEELAEMSNQYGMGADESPTGPQLVYYFKVTQQEHTEAVAAAFTDAKGKAEELAAPTGATLGKVRAVYKNESAFDMAYQYGVYDASQQPEAGELEAVSAQPGEATYQVDLGVAFELRQDE